MRLFGSKTEKKCSDIVALLIESNAVMAATQMNKLNGIFCISLGWFNNAVFGKEIVVGFKLTEQKCISCDSSNVQQSCSGAKK